jgi:acyl-CoA synthetase (AMP-forming)/AMP-acid ligase II
LIDPATLQRMEAEAPAERLTLWDLATAADPDQIAVVCQRNGKVTYRQLCAEAEGLARFWFAQGIGPGDRVILQTPNWYEFSLAHLALTRIGAITVPLLPSYREAELRFISQATEATSIVAAPGFRTTADADVFDRLVKEVPSLSHWWAVDGEPSLRDVALGGRGDLPPLPDPSDVTLILASSGTTGQPKLAMHSHRSTVGGGLRQVAKTLGLGSSDVIFMPSPVGHATGVQYGVRFAMLLGATLVLQVRWNADEATQLIEEHGATFTIGATPFLYDLCALDIKDRRRLKSLTRFVCGGAPIPVDLANSSLERLPDTSVLPAWGMSETGIATMVLPGDGADRISGTDGKPIVGWEVRIADEVGSPVPTGETGEIQVRGVSMFLGYLGRPDLTSEVVPDGWLHTGDIGRLDSDGYLRCLGRIKDLIIRGGMNISATEVENLVRRHPAVSDVAVVGEPDPRLGERICAVIVPEDDVAPTVEELTEFLLAIGVSKLKLPERVVQIDSLPMSPIGKVQKFIVREHLASLRS